jgi:hypothetical protein
MSLYFLCTLIPVSRVLLGFRRKFVFTSFAYVVFILLRYDIAELERPSPAN